MTASATRQDRRLRTLTYAASAAALSRSRRDSIVVCVPTRDEASTIGPICRELVGLRRAGAIDRVVVVDDSEDATPFIAADAGADVYCQRDLMPEFGAVVGKGDAMWRALAVCDEDIVAFVDGDTTDFRAEMASDLVAAIALDGFDFAKATYRRPFAAGTVIHPTGGGRVTELTAKPLLRAFTPELRQFGQPLAGELAARANLLRDLRFATGYSVDVALLIDAWRAVGIGAMAQVDTDVRQNRHRPLDELGPMADEVVQAILSRVGLLGDDAERLLERPAFSVAGRAIAVPRASATA